MPVGSKTVPFLDGMTVTVSVSMSTSNDASIGGSSNSDRLGSTTLAMVRSSSVIWIAIGEFSTYSTRTALAIWSGLNVKK